MKTRLDYYCREVLRLKTSSGSTKYPHLTNVVKTALVLPYGNADVERGMSENNRVVTAERNQLGEDTINGLRATKGMVKFSDPQQLKQRRTCQLTVKSFVQPDQHILSTRVNSKKIKKKR